MSSVEFDPQLDKITDKELNLTLREQIAIAFAHVNAAIPHITSDERNLWTNKWDYKTAARVTESTDGIMEFKDKIKLDGIETNANKYIHPDGYTAGSYIKVKVDSKGHVVEGSNPTYLKIRVEDSDNLGGIAAGAYAVLNSPNFTGIPTAPTAAKGTNNTQIATTAFVNTAIPVTVNGNTLTFGTVTIGVDNVGMWLSNNGGITKKYIIKQTLNVGITQSSNQLITVSCNGVSYTSAFTAEYGDSYTASISANSGYKVGTLSTTSGVVKNDMIISASPATLNALTVSVNQTANQTIYVTSNGGTYTSTFSAIYGSTYSVSINPAAGYNAGSLNTTSGTIVRDISISANPASIQYYTVQISQSANQTIYVSCNGGTYTSSFNAPYGSTYSAWVSPASNYNAGGISSSNGTITGGITISAGAASVMGGSKDFGETSGTLWTCPNGITRVWCQWDNYYKVTPGTVYKVGAYNGMCMGKYVAGTGPRNYYIWSMSDRGNVLYWGPQYEGHEYSKDMDSYLWYETNSNCDCDCSDGCGCGSCFIAGTKVMCYNDITNEIYYENIENIVPNTIVIGANGEKNRVLALYETKLGDYRSIMSFKDKSLYFSDEHPFWVRENGIEQFGVHNYNSYYKEKVSKDKDGFTMLDHELSESLNVSLQKFEGLEDEPAIICKEMDYATTIGFVTNIASVDRSYGSDTKLYSPITNGNHTLYVNGYLVGSFMLNDYNYKNISIFKSINALKELGYNDNGKFFK